MEDDAPPVVHRAPPPDDRPRSKLAVWALALALLLAVPAALGGLWILAVPALVLAAWALVRVKPAEAKGHGMALVALILSLTAGSCGVLNAAAFRSLVDRIGRGTLEALSDPESTRPLEDWFTPRAREAGVPSRVRERYEAAVAAHGPYQGELVTESPLLGAKPFLPPPADSVREIGADEGDEEARPEGQPLWVRARFRDAVLRLEFVLTTSDLEALQRFQTGGDAEAPPALVEDLHFHADR